MATRTETPRRERTRVPEIGAGADLGAGLLAGLIGAGAMALWSMTYAGITGIGFSMPLKLVAGSVVGVEALVGDAGVMMVGGVIHMLTGMAYGAVFVWLLDEGSTPGIGMMLGMLYGAMILAAMTFVVLPLVNPVMRARVELIPFSWVVTHLIYGLTVGLLTPIFRRSFA